MLFLYLLLDSGNKFRVIAEVYGMQKSKEYIDSPIHAPTDTLTLGLPEKLSCVIRRVKRRTVADLPSARSLYALRALCQARMGKLAMR